VFLGIDHLVIAVADPDAAAAEIQTALGLEPGGGGRHDRLGTFNRLVWLGDSYLELIGVFDPGLAASSWVGAPTLRALETGGGLATWAIATDAIDADLDDLRAMNTDLALPMDGERTRPDGAIVRWRLAAAPNLGPTRPPFLIEHVADSAEWTAADRAARAGGPARLTVLELAVDDLGATSRAMLRTAGLRFRPSLAGGGARDADIGRQRLRLRPRRDAHVPIATIHLSIAGARPADIDLFGCRWVVRPAED
jgi:Glyoxalase-like domain